MIKFFFFGYPIYFPLLVSLAVFTFIGLRQPEKSRSFFIAIALNAFAVFSTACTFLLIFSGGHPVKQMSQGNYQAWSNWLYFFPIPALGLMGCILIAGILSLILLVRWGKSKSDGIGKCFLYSVLTLIHCFVASHWLWNFMPDA